MRFKNTKCYQNKCIKYNLLIIYTLQRYLNIYTISIIFTTYIIQLFLRRYFIKIVKYNIMIHIHILIV